MKRNSHSKKLPLKETPTQRNLDNYLNLKKGFKGKTLSRGLTKSVILTGVLPCMILASGYGQIKSDLTINETDTHGDLPGAGYAEKLFIPIDQGFSGGGQHSGFTKVNPGNAQVHARMNSASIWFAGTADMKFVGGGYPAVLTSMASINAGNVAAGYSTGTAGFPMQFFLTYKNQVGGNWTGTGEQVGYVGFSFKIGSNTHYGFMEIGVTPDDNNNGNGGKAFRLIGIGYEQTPGVGINSILPVELINLKASAKDAQVSLSWTTASETNNAGFEIQRSTDGINFKSLTFIEGKGTSFEQNEYYFDDKELRKGQLYYYRLKQIDFDGQFEFSKVITAQLKVDGITGLFSPNPAGDGQTRLDYRAVEEGQLTLRVFDISGKELMIQNHQAAKGANRFDLNFSALGKGMFFVKMEQGAHSSYQKLILK